MSIPPVRDRVVLVTGAARGIGAGTARELAARGARLALVGLEPEQLAALAAELGPGHSWAEADVTDQDALDAAVAATVERHGRLDAVLANAGVASYGTIRQIDPADFQRVVDVNLTGVFRTLHATLPHLVDSGGYALVVSSLAAFAPVGGLAPYAATKAAVESLALATRQEVAHLGVGVGVCHPGWIATDMVLGTEDDLPWFKASRRQMPWPANTHDVGRRLRPGGGRRHRPAGAAGVRAARCRGGDDRPPADHLAPGRAAHPRPARPEHPAARGRGRAARPRLRPAHGRLTPTLGLTFPGRPDRAQTRRWGRRLRGGGRAASAAARPAGTRRRPRGRCRATPGCPCRRRPSG